MTTITIETVRSIIARVKSGEQLFDMGCYCVYVPQTKPKSEFLEVVYESLQMGRPTENGRAFAHQIPAGEIEVIKAFEEEYGFAPKGEFICFNPDSFATQEALEFVVAHELGHIVKGHVRKFLGADSFTDEEFIQKELEADEFGVSVTGHISTALKELRRFCMDGLSPLRRKEKTMRIQQLEAMM